MERNEPSPNQKGRFLNLGYRNPTGLGGAQRFTCLQFFNGDDGPKNICPPLHPGQTSHPPHFLAKDPRQPTMKRQPLAVGKKWEQKILQNAKGKGGPS